MQYMKDSGKWVEQLSKENSHTLKERYMKAIGIMIRLKVLEPIHTPMEQDTTVNGSKIFSMERVRNNGLMGLNLVVNTEMVRKMD